MFVYLLHGKVRHMAPTRRHDRVFCIEESAWRDQLDDRMSVLPTLELLEQTNAIDRFVHRHALGPTEFED